ncbi:MAG: hydroxyacylglutathione hydrolase [Gammaproteobacteria bacterium]|nr:hydroxyacylglutathione hydrolase [Gammaproteobacteria bacterium]
MLEIRPIPAFGDNYIWLAGVPESPGAVIVIDPGTAGPVIEVFESEGLRPSAILITHRHWDHVDGVPELASRYQVPVFGPEGGHIAGVTAPVVDGTTVEPLRGLSFKVLAVPGHTADHLAYFGHGTLFCGDTLFNAGCGRLFDGTARQLFHSLQRLSELPDTTRVCCAHEYTLDNLEFARMVEPGNADLAEYARAAATLRDRGLPTLPTDIGTQRRINPFLRCECDEVRASVTAFAGRPLAGPEETFKVLRYWKDTW